MDKSVSKIPCTIDTFFHYWLDFLAPIHKLPKKDSEILAYILKKRYELSKIVTDDSQIDKFLFSTDVRDEIIEENGITKNSLQVALTHLRKTGILEIGDKVHKKFIPNLSKDSTRFDLMLLFEIQEDVTKKS
jgi:hypothetical protein